MKINRARMYHPACLEIDEAGIREIEQMIDLGDASVARLLSESENTWPTHIVCSRWSASKGFTQWFVQEEG